MAYFLVPSGRQNLGRKHSKNGNKAYRQRGIKHENLSGTNTFCLDEQNRHYLKGSLVDPVTQLRSVRWPCQFFWKIKQESFAV